MLLFTRILFPHHRAVLISSNGNVNQWGVNRLSHAESQITQRKICREHLKLPLNQSKYIYAPIQPSYIVVIYYISVFSLDMKQERLKVTVV